MVVILDPSLGFAETRHGLVNFNYQGNSYYTPRDYCMIFLYTNPDSVIASGRILERNGTYYFEFEFIDGEDFGPDNLHNYIRIWAYTDSIQESRHITPFLPSWTELNLVFDFGAHPNCYGIGGGGNPGGP
ncbi:MAG: hypothetical protein AMJ41_02540 [candidate division Zixibacteria bacterium DG_27]|nr:MAG: hypothetical protein AMJ41_02540 [candidate division Zixibacteria bacterium DG_27]